MIIGKEKILFIDTGMGIGNTRLLGNNLLDSANKSKPVILALTHSHLDHTGGIKYFAWDTIYMYDHLRMYDVANHGIQWDNLFEFAAEEDIPLCSLDGTIYEVSPFHYHRMLHNKDYIDIGDRKIEVIHTPWHSSDSVSYYDKENKILFCGDIAYYGPIYLYLESASLEDYRQTIDRLAILDIEYILCGHNEYEIEKDFFKKVQDIFRNKTIDEIIDLANNDGEIIVCDPIVGKQSGKERIARLCLKW